MKLINSLRLAFVLFSVFFPISLSYAQTYANDESHASNLTCIACVVINAANAVDGDNATYSTVSLTVGTLGAYVYQRLQFPATASNDEYLTIEIEGPGLATLDATALACLRITTYNNGVSNGDTQGSTDFTIEQIGTSSKYMVEIQPSADFDEVELRMVGGSIGALTQLRIYFSLVSTTSLPVELTYFKGAFSNPANVLEWSTASEIHNDFFTIEKSADGINFEELITIKGAGTSNMPLYYHFNDEKPFVGNNFYRLKQTDHNGQVQYSSIISIHSKCININQFTFGPNPVVDFLNLFYGSDENCFVVVKILNVDGECVYNKTLESTKGLNVFTINEVASLRTGIYSLYVITDNDMIFKRIIKM
jgi:hypothetical protein